MERYSEYKDSGVYYIPQIPSEWNVLKGKILFKQEKRPVNKEDEIVTCFRDGEVTLRKNRRLEGFTNSLKEIGYQGIRKGDLVIHNMDAFAGAIGVSDSDGKGTPVYAVCTPIREDANQFYYCYLLRFLAKTGFIQSLAKGIRERSTDFRYGDFKELLLPVPSRAEQDAIVLYLDTATSEIDKAIAMQQKMIDLLNERKQIIIQNAVTKGLDENVEMKESGVEWIGKIPKHWEVRRGKFLFRVVNEYSTTGQEELLTVSDRTGITPRSMKNFNMFMSESLIGYKKCQKGDICSNIMWMWHGAVGVTEYNGVISPSYGVYRQIAVNYDNKYLDYMLRLPRLVEVYGICSTGLTESRLRLYPDDFMNIQFFIPPVEEQKSIVLQIQKQITDIEKSIRNAENLITLLQERKQIIINEVVTGKVRVI